ncbi:MFS transporter [Phyllobacterium sp. 0TCS1.6C]|uniref:MFS transporter n=1 Tax=unclassified Phyllobacterium TaxID=2638441 RepID=UPI0022651261|nr:MULTISPECIES: MFS transporter [unclassified Phyllobacterium]MCX8281722.1 MFS transporter [Phyllobacterium sp. 0TCS1.6C]MCX8294832.1 MFS transporter [Phyllobacterium sp. 0TCS1.6A]
MDASRSQPDQTRVRTHWRALVAAIATISAVGVAIGLGIPLLSVILESRGHSATMIGLNAAVAGVASIIAAPFAAPIAARLGVVPTLLIMLLIGGLSFFGFHFFTQFWVWVILRIFLHFALTMLFILSEYWINAAAPPDRRGLVLGIYGTVLSMGFALGPWLFAHIGSSGIMPFAVGFAIIILAMVPVMFAWNDSPDFHEEEHVPFAPFIWAVPTATAAVFVFGAVETGGFALFPVFGARIGYTEANAALLLTTIGLGNVLMQIPIGLLSDHVKDRRKLLLACSVIGLAGMCLLPFIYLNWYLVAALLFVWGGAVAGLYTVGLAHLGSQLTGRELASANAAFVFCYAIGMLVGPQAIGIGMDLMGPGGFAISLAVFFAAYALLVGGRLLRRHG